MGGTGGRCSSAVTSVCCGHILVPKGQHTGMAAAPTQELLSHRPRKQPAACAGAMLAAQQHWIHPCRCGDSNHPALLFPFDHHPSPGCSRQSFVTPGLLPEIERFHIWTSSCRKLQDLEISLLEANLIHSINALIYPFVTTFNKGFGSGRPVLINHRNQF